MNTGVLFLFLFSAVTVKSLGAMEAVSSQKINFSYKIEKFSRKVRAFYDYVNDDIDYFESLKLTFNPHNPLKVKRFDQNLALLNADHRKMCKENLIRLKNDNKDASEDALKRASMQNFIGIFEDKIEIRRKSIELYERLMKAINSQNYDLLFRSQLSSYSFYIKSRMEVIMRDSAPVFSSMLKHYGEFDRRRIENEITKHELMLDSLKLLQSLANSDNYQIQAILSYLPVMADYLKNPTLKIELDSFCLDGLVMRSSGLSLKGVQLLSHEELLFGEDTQLPIINASELNAIKDPSFLVLKILWDQTYTNKMNTFAPSVLIEPQAESPKKKNPPVHTQRKRTNNNRNKLSPTPKQISYKQKTQTSVPEIALNLQTIEETKIAPLQDKPASLVADIRSEPVPEDKILQKTTREKKEQKDILKAQARKSEFLKSSESKLLDFKVLSIDDKFYLNTKNYGIMCDLLTNKLSPNVHYEEIIGALEAMGIKVEMRGNGDYRKLLLPNGRKIFIFRPAAPQVGHRFLKKLRVELPEKWGLAIDNLGK